MIPTFCLEYFGKSNGLHLDSTNWIIIERYIKKLKEILIIAGRFAVFVIFRMKHKYNKGTLGIRFANGFHTALMNQYPL